MIVQLLLRILQFATPRPPHDIKIICPLRNLVQLQDQKYIDLMLVSGFCQLDNSSCLKTVSSSFCSNKFKKAGALFDINANLLGKVVTVFNYERETLIVTATEITGREEPIFMRYVRQKMK